MTEQETRRAARLLCAALNDAFRTMLGSGRRGQVVMTRGVAALPLDTLALVLQSVATFCDFTPDNDPHGEHDFGAFEAGDSRIFWKIDYYADDSMEHGAENALDCYRVLTIMFAEEY